MDESRTQELVDRFRAWMDGLINRTGREPTSGDLASVQNDFQMTDAEFAEVLSIEVTRNNHKIAKLEGKLARARGHGKQKHLRLYV